jgi:hypothetical protein
METSRNNATGEISVQAKAFAVTITEDAVKILVNGVVVNEWKPDSPATLPRLPDRADMPSPRAAVRNRKRGSR